MEIKLLHTADWHLGTFRSPTKDGRNLRTEDTKRCLAEMLRVARKEKPDYSLISGDVFHVGRLWSDRCCEEILTASHYMKELAAVSKQVIVMRGTPNHDGEGQFHVLAELFADVSNVHVVMTPQVLSFADIDIAVLPGFDKGGFRAEHAGLSGDEENLALTNELSNIVMSLKAQCTSGKKSVLMAHCTVSGCNMESGQTMMLAQLEPILSQETLLAANYDFAALGHIHRPQKLQHGEWYYAGAVNAMNFNDEGQERGFWIHDWQESRGWQSFFHKTPIREFATIQLSDEDITQINMQAMRAVAAEKWKGLIGEKIVRVHYSCTSENRKVLNQAALEKQLLADGAFMVWEILPDRIYESVNQTELAHMTDPETNLRKYLEEKQVPPEKIQELVWKARPVIAEAQAGIKAAAHTGAFEPMEIAVKNYRSYAEEIFCFTDITFCTINGQNGAGKSSLFMDAIIDCLYEEPREGVIKAANGKAPWLRNDERVRSGFIKFTFRIGEKMYRVTRTRTRSGKGTLNLAQFIDEEWKDCSKERYNDTQQEILNMLGMDSFTFKSCALIMQDQYGLFLQAKLEERMEVLSTLLGLDIYQKMEKISSDRAKVTGVKSRELKQEIMIHNEALSEFGKPEETLEICKTELADLEHSLQEKLSAKSQLLQRALQLAGASALYTSKKHEAEQLMGQAETEQKNIAELRKAIQVKQDEKCALLFTLENEREIRQKVEVYNQKKAELEAMREQAVAYEKARAAYDKAVFRYDEIEKRFDTEKQAADEKKKVLEKKVEILNESGCVDLAHAHCKFLQDAMEAREELAAHKAWYADIAARRVSETAKAKQAVDETAAKVRETAFNTAEFALLQSACAACLPYAAQLEGIQQSEQQLALLDVDLRHLHSKLSETERRLAEAQCKRAQAERACAGYAKAFDEYAQLQKAADEIKVNELECLIKETQMRVGALQQKVEQAAKRKQQILALQKKQVEYAKESADYDLLKTAFSQSGVPHQMIRSIIPQLTETANTILGQMTGGKMGVEFRLERLQKNGKEKGSLDIFIEEYGKPALPYLSKSGGEKVKCSLSVILALAELKSSAAGIQLGMLFIDEPPFLDGDGMQAYCDALETIWNRYKNMKIMAVTHDPMMKARFPQNIDVVKTEHGSKLICERINGC